jgi:hypothetical protein
MTISGIALVVAVAIPWSRAAGQNPAPPSLPDQLQAQYKVARLGGDSSGPTIIEPGTVLTIQKAGILGVSPSTVVVCPVKYQDGSLHPPSSLCAAMVKRTSRPFQVGEKVYITKLDVNSKNDKVSVKIVACDSCNGTNPPTSYKSQVDFQFAKGILETGDAAKVEDIIGQIFAIETSTPEAPAAAPAAAPADQPAAAEPAPAPAPAPAPPASIELGQTIDQVVGALGQPDKIVKLGAKQIYVYKDLKVTFVDGKVSDVQ